MDRLGSDLHCHLAWMPLVNLIEQYLPAGINVHFEQLSVKRLQFFHGLGIVACGEKDLRIPRTYGYMRDNVGGIGGKDGDNPLWNLFIADNHIGNEYCRLIEAPVSE